MIHSKEPSREDDLDDTQEPEDLGVFINAVGETWRWRPRDMKRTIEAAKTKLGLSRDAIETSTVLGAGFEDPESSDWELSNNKLASSATKDNIIGTDSRTIRSATSGHCMTCSPWRMIGALAPDGQNSNSPNAGCTATKVGPRHLLTAGHCVHTGGSGGALVEKDWWSGQDGMDFYANGGDPSPNGVRNIEWYWIHPDWMSKAKTNRDYAVIMLYDSSSTVGLGWFGLKVDNTLANTSAWNFGYPGWGNTCANSNWPGNSCRNSLWGMSAKITRTTSRMAYYKHDTQGGQSGSPVYQNNGGNRQIIAVHKGGYSSLENRGVKITSYVFDTIMAVRAAWPSIYD